MFLRLLQRIFFPAPPMKLLAVGAAAPDFEVLDHEGRTVTSAQLEGNRYVLWFYPKADTPG